MAGELLEVIFNFASFIAKEVQLFHEFERKAKSDQELLSGGGSKRSFSQPSPITKYPRAVLIASSSMDFGNACERLVNIAFQTSQTFPTIMNSCADIDRYLCKELAKQYGDEHFHIIIGENQQFGFSLDDGQYFAEIEQERYRILIFSTKQNSSMKPDTHDANSQMILKWS